MFQQDGASYHYHAMKFVIDLKGKVVPVLNDLSTTP
jgi:hypothetical protein